MCRSFQKSPIDNRSILADLDRLVCACMHDSSMLDPRSIDTLLCAGRHLPGSIARPTAHAIELRDRGAHIMAGDPVPWPRAGGPAMPAVHGTPPPPPRLPPMDRSIVRLLLVVVLGFSAFSRADRPKRRPLPHAPRPRAWWPVTCER